MIHLLEQEVKQHVYQLFEQLDTSNLWYHNYQHTANVVHRIATLSQHLPPTEVLLLKIAAWFHDIGYLYGYDNHEDRGIDIALSYLHYKLNPAQQQIIATCIEATKMTQEPRTLLEALIKDADIGYGTTELFFETGPLLRKEWAAILNKTYTNQAWEQLQYNFLNQVIFYSEQAQKLYTPQLQQNIEAQKKRIHFR